jgi:hypothetical protein
MSTTNVTINGSTSDGYHTFDELYDHRITLWIALCRKIREANKVSDVWRSRVHSDGSSFDGWFVLGTGYARGEQITYHLPLSRWNETDFAHELDHAPPFDGHTSADLLARIARL